MLPNAVALSLILPLTPSDAPAPDANLLRRGFLASLREQHPELPAWLHDDPGPGGHPWSVSDPFLVDGDWFARVTAIGRTVCRGLGRSMRPGPLAATKGWRVGPEAHWRARGVARAQLAITPRRERATIVVTLLSPTTLSAADGGETAEVTAAELVLAWARRWSRHFEASLPGPLGGVQPALLRPWISERVDMLDAALENVPVQTSRGIRAVGARGAVLMRLTGSAEEVAALAALARFGTFSGTGRRLAHGFGQTITFDRPVDWEMAVALHRPVPFPR